MLSDMRPYYLYPLLASSLDDYFRDLLLLSFLGSMEEEDYEDLEGGSDIEDELDDDEDEEEDEEEEDEEGEEEESDYEESEEEDDVDEPVPPKRRLLNNLTSQPMGASSSSTATIITNHHAILRSEQGNSSQPVSMARRTPSTQPTVSLGIPHALIQVSQRPVQLQSTVPQNRQQPAQQRPNATPSANLHSRSQQVQTDTPENNVPRPLIRQVSQHNLPQARVVLRLPNNIGDMYPREE